jgi:hypothetical protein
VDNRIRGIRGGSDTAGRTAFDNRCSSDLSEFYELKVILIDAERVLDPGTINIPDRGSGAAGISGGTGNLSAGDVGRGDVPVPV